MNDERKYTKSSYGVLTPIHEQGKRYMIPRHIMVKQREVASGVIELILNDKSEWMLATATPMKFAGHLAAVKFFKLKMANKHKTGTIIIRGPGGGEYVAHNGGFIHKRERK